MSKTTTENLEVRFARVRDLQELAEQLSHVIHCVGHSDGPVEFDANLDDILEFSKELVAAVNEIKETV